MATTQRNSNTVRISRRMSTRDARLIYNDVDDVAWLKNFGGYYPTNKKTIRMMLTLAGDVELNPGPVMSKLVTDACYNRFSAYAQLNPGFQALPVEDAPRMCRVCGQRDTDCKCWKYLAQSAGPFLSVVAGILRLVRELTAAHAQIGFGIFESTNKCMNSVGEMAEEAKSTLGSLQETVSNIPQMVRDVLESNCGFLPISIKTVLVMSASLVGMYVIYRMCGLTASMLDVCLRVLSNVCSLPVLIVDLFREWVAYVTKPLAQVGDDIDDPLAFITSWTPTVVPMFFSLVTAGLLGSLPGAKLTPDLWMRRVADFPRACRGMGDIFRYVKTWFQYAVRFVEKQIWGIENTDGVFPELESWMTEVLTAAKDMRTACATQGSTERVCGLWRAGSGLLRKYQTSLPREEVEAIKRTLILAAKLEEQARSLYLRPEGVRMVPQLNWFVGESQIGKTTLTYYIAAEILDCFGMAHLVAEHVYTRCPENEYFDGYNGQYIMTYDDFGQKRDSVANPSVEFFEIIRSISNFPYHLHMAAIEQKAGSFFNSKAVLCSTNDRNVRVDSLTYPDAVWNRVTFAFEVRIKPEYQQPLEINGRSVITLDKKKAYEKAPVVDGRKQMVNLDVYEFYRFDARQRAHPEFSGPYSYSEMIKMLKDDMKIRISRGADLTADIMQYATALNTAADVSAFFPKQVDGYAQSGEDFQDASDEVQPWMSVTVKTVKEWIMKVFNTEMDVHDGPYLCALAYSNELVGLDDRQVLGDLDESEFVYTFSELYTFMKMPLFVEKHSGLKKMADTLIKMWTAVKQRTRELKERILDPLWVSFKNLINKLVCENTWTLMGATAALIGLAAIYKRSKADPTEKAESHNPITQPKHRQLRTYKKGFVRRVGQAEVVKEPLPILEEGLLHGDAEVAADQTQWDMICTVYKQQYLIYPVVDGVERSPLGVLTMMRGSIAMMPYHFKIYLDLMKPDLIRLKSVYLPTGKEMEFSEFITNQNCIVIERELLNGEKTYSDICYLDLSKKMPPCKDITKYFVDSRDLDRLTGQIPVALAGPAKMNDGIALMCLTGNAVPRDHVRYDIANPTGVKGEHPCLIARDLYEYGIPTQPGFCGQLLSVSSTLLAKKFVGMHVAGSKSGRNWSCLVTGDDLDSVMSEFSPVAQMCQNFSDRPACVKVVPGEFLPVCQIDDGPCEIAKSTIIPSSMHGRLTEPTTIPAKLRPFVHEGVKRDPLAIGVMKAGRCTPTCSTAELKVASGDVYRSFMEGLEEPLKVLTIEEAVAGVPGDELRNPISTVTSPGYGWDRHGMKGKTYYLGTEGFNPESEGFSELKRACEELVNNIKQGNTLNLLSLDCLKDERRPREKVLAGKTRVFTVLPMHLNIVIRQYFMDGIVAIRRNRIRNGTGVGLNVWSNEWEYMYKYLAEISTTNCGDGDFGNLDGTLMDKILWEVFEVIDRMYDDTNTEIRKALWMQLVYCVRYYRGAAYQCTHSLPSGIFGTSDFGSTYLLIAFRYIWLKIAPRNLRTMKAFNEHVRLMTYGDDNVWSISDVAKEFWNMQVLTDEFTKLGMQYTDAAKTGEIAGFKTLHEVQFLKRFWKWSDVLQRHTCPADLLGRLETLNWTRRNSVVDPRTIESDVVQDVLKEIAAHGEEAFNEWAPKIVKTAISCGVPNVHLEHFLHYHVPSGVDIPVGLQVLEVN